jgi:hypothetical protein
MWKDFDRSIDGLERHVLGAAAPPGQLAQNIAGRITDGSLRLERNGKGAH